MDARSQVDGPATERRGLYEEGIKARDGRSDGYTRSGHLEGSVERMSMEEGSFKGPSLSYIKLSQITDFRKVKL